MLPPLLAIELEMLVHDNLAILPKYAQDFSALSQILRPGVDVDMNSSAYCSSISRDRLPCKRHSGDYHAPNEAVCTKCLE